MPSLQELLIRLDEALTVAALPHGAQRLAALSTFMAGFEAIAAAVVKGTATWDAARPWAEQSSHRLLSAYDAFQDWQRHLAELIYGNSDEERLERALAWRSQHALARDLFRGTPAEEMLSAYDDARVDNDLRERADGYGLHAPDWAPPSHSWWKQASE